MAKSAMALPGAKRKPPKTPGQKLTYCLVGFLGSFLLMFVVMYLLLIGTESPTLVLEDSMKELGREMTFGLAFRPSGFPEGLGAPSDHSSLAIETSQKAKMQADSALAQAQAAQMQVNTALAVLQIDPGQAQAQADSALAQAQAAQSQVGIALADAQIASTEADSALSQAATDSIRLVAQDAKAIADSVLSAVQAAQSQIEAILAQAQAVQTQAAAAVARADSLAQRTVEEEARRRAPLVYDAKRVRQLARIFSAMEPQDVAP
ncbi:MAG: hypothetical protein HY709_06785, partial [Candidatus Latescibacteria bacterium]|nr:hypothetical protein [Candidatus Latescibacterota bacterium]